MMTSHLSEHARLLRLRDGIYADDLVLAAVVRLDLLTVMAEQPGTLDDLCRRNGIARRPADVLCTLLRAMELVELGDVLRPTALARSALVRGAPYDLRPYLASGASRTTCLDQVELLRTGQPAAWTAGRTGVWPHDPMFGEFLAGEQARARIVAPPVADLIAELAVSSVLVVGGSGVMAKLLADRDIAFGAGQLNHHDMFEMWPTRYDAHVLSHTLHCWSAQDVRRIIARSFDALPPGGWFVDHDTHLNATKSGPLAVARYSALLLHATEGQCWSVAEIASFLSDAGFTDIEERPCGLDRTALVARRP